MFAKQMKGITMKQPIKATFSDAYDQCAEIMNNVDDPKFDIERAKVKLTSIDRMQKLTGRQIEVARLNLQGFDHVFKPVN